MHVRASHQGEDDRVAKLKSAMSDVQRDEDGEISFQGGSFTRMSMRDCRCAAWGGNKECIHEGLSS